MANVVKRAIDLTAAATGLGCLFPLLVVVAAAIKLHDGGPVFHRGIRVGQYGKLFRIFKFRTMPLDSESKGPSSTSEDDPRITSVGRFLRRYKLDELPQLLNVLRGEMSFVGPRPQVEWAVALYSPEEQALMRVRPGITDYASLKFRNEGELLRGSADPDRAYLEKIAPEKIRLGLEYVRHHNMFIDLKIVLGTAGAILGIDPGWCLPKQQDVARELGLAGDTGNRESL